MNEFFSYFINLSSILGNLGMLVMGIAAWLGINSIFDEKKSKRSDAASLILSKVRRCFDEIIDITDKGPQFSAYPKGSTEENDNESKHFEVPAMLVEHKIKQLRFDLHDPAARLSLNESTQLFDILDLIKRNCGKVAENISKAEEEKSEPNGEDILASYRDLFKNLVSETEKLLIPIIESGDLK